MPQTLPIPALRLRLAIARPQSRLRTPVPIPRLILPAAVRAWPGAHLPGPIRERELDQGFGLVHAPVRALVPFMAGGQLFDRDTEPLFAPGFIATRPFGA